MIKANNYVRTVIDADAMLKDFGNKFRVVASRAYNGKAESNIPAGTTFTLQVLEDHAAPQIDKETGLPKDNNVFETFDVTIPGCQYPSGIVKGDFVSLGKFLPEISYYIKYNMILRFGEIRKITKNPSTVGGKNVAG